MNKNRFIKDLMRLWTLHPQYLDTKGLLAVWREGLLAQKVLAGRTKGYTRHPQLFRFRAQKDPLAAIAAFLSAIADEAENRNYHFDRKKIGVIKSAPRITETKGQLLFEWEHFKTKLRKRAPLHLESYKGVKTPQAHPLFRITRGSVREWEKTS